MGIEPINAFTELLLFPTRNVSKEKAIVRVALSALLGFVTAFIAHLVAYIYCKYKKRTETEPSKIGELTVAVAQPRENSVSHTATIASVTLKGTADSSQGIISESSSTLFSRAIVVNASSYTPPSLPLEEVGKNLTVFQELFNYITQLIGRGSIDESEYLKVRELIANGVDLTDLNGKDRQLFRNVARSFNVTLMQILCSMDAKITKQLLNSTMDRTPTIVCIDRFFEKMSKIRNEPEREKEHLYFQATEMIRCLLAEGFDPTTKFQSTTILQHLCQMWHSNAVLESPHSIVLKFFKTVVELFIDHVVNLNDPFFVIFFLDRGESALLKKVIEKGVRLPLKRTETEAEKVAREDRVRVQKDRGDHEFTIEDNRGLNWTALIKDKKNEELIPLVISTLIVQNPDNETDLSNNLADAIRTAIVLGEMEAVKILQKAGAQLPHETYLFLEKLYLCATSPIHALLNTNPVTKENVVYAATQNTFLIYGPPQEVTVSIKKEIDAARERRITGGQLIEELGTNIENLMNIATMVTKNPLGKSILITYISFVAIIREIEWFITTIPINSYDDVKRIDKIIDKILNQNNFVLSDDELMIINKCIDVINQLVDFNKWSALPPTILHANPILLSFIEIVKTVPPKWVTKGMQRCLFELKKVYDPFARQKREIKLQVAPANLNPLVDLIVEYSNGDHHVNAI